MSNDRKIKIKVVFGYIFIMIFAIAGSWYLYSKVVNLVVSGGSERGSLYKKSIAVTKVISSLYQTEYNSGILLRNYSRNSLNNYNLIVDTLNSNLKELRSMTISEEQIKLLNDIEYLIGQKESNFKELAKLYNTATSNNIYNKAIDKAIVETVSKNDTVSTIVAPRRSLFRRIGDIFSPPKPDTLLAIKDEVTAQTLQTLKSEIATESVALNRKREAKYNQLVIADQKISKHIATLIFQLNSEASANYAAEHRAIENDLRATATFVALLVIASLLIVIVFVLFILRDINRSSVYKKELETARNRAEYLMRSRHKMLLNISHDIKAPLCSVTGYLDLIKNSNDLKVREYAESMKISTSYIMDLITNLLEFSRLEAGKSEVDKSHFDIDILLADIISIFEIQATTKGISLKLNRLNCYYHWIESDKMRIRQITMNLLSNSVKFTQRGSIVVSYEVTTDNQLILKIEDSGCGIAKERQSDIYDEFSRINSTIEVEGSGLGLSVVRGNVLLLGGEIALESEEGSGTQFTVKLPIIKAEPIVIAENVKSNNFNNSEICCGYSINSSENGSLKILVIDDDFLQLRMCVEMLHLLGCSATTACTIKEAEDIILSEDIDLVLSDLQMGNFSGFDLLHHIRTIGYTLPVVAVSANDDSILDSVAGSGFNAFLKKPFTIYALKGVIEQFGDKINISSIEELMMGDTECAKELIELFYTTTQENIKLLEEYAELSNFAEIKKLCHKMLPMFLQLNIHHIAQQLSDIDRSSVSGIKMYRVLFLVEALKQFMSKRNIVV